VATLTYSFPAVGGSNPCWTYDANGTNNNHFNNYKNNETMFKTIYTITVGEFAEMLATNDYKLAVTVKWLPKFISRIAYIKLNNEFNKYFNIAVYNNTIAKYFKQLNLQYLVEVSLPATKALIYLYDITINYHIKGMIKDVFEKTYHIKFDDDTYKDTFNKHSKRILDKYNQVTTKFINDVNDATNDNSSFEKFVIYLEDNLNSITIRDKKLYTVKHYTELVENKHKKHV